MNKVSGAIKEINRVDEVLRRDTWLNHIHPLAKLSVTIVYIIMVVSYSRHQIKGILLMAIYPAVLFVTGEISFLDSIRRMKIVLPLVCMVGIFNPFFDRNPVVNMGRFVVTSGMLSMLILMMKGILCVLASYLLIVSTSVENICYSLRILHMPAVLVTQILLTYRYISLLLAEAEQTVNAYALRAPGQKGIHWKVWGSLAGGLLLRSMDRATQIYESMTLRGYNGEFCYGKKRSLEKRDIKYVVVWLGMFVSIKIFV